MPRLASRMPIWDSHELGSAGRRLFCREIPSGATSRSAQKKVFARSSTAGPSALVHEDAPAGHENGRLEDCLQISISFQKQKSTKTLVYLVQESQDLTILETLYTFKNQKKAKNPSRA
ncbi:unnamed protein product [Sympodiomycopsis kandeliae]